MREGFEAYIQLTQKQSQPWELCERSPDHGGEGYLDLYTQLRWEGWKAAYARLT